jgi:glycosyltransferase involved in cell wall biosynthesis
MTAESTERSPVRVSVLIQTFNHARYVARALDSVLDQRGVDSLEVLVGDDCSTDATRSVIDEYVQRHPGRIKTFYPEQNMGGAGKTLFAELITRSQGSYIAQLDGDDYWTSADKLRLQADHLDAERECAMCFHNVVNVYEDGESPDDYYNSPEQSPYVGLEELFASCLIASCSPMFRREVLDPLPPWYFRVPWGDWPLYFMAAERGRIDYLPDVLGVYRIHPDGMYSGQSPLTQKTLLVDFLHGLAGVVTDGEQLRRRRLATALVDLAQEHVQRGERAAARQRLGESFRIWPMTRRTLRRGQGERRRLSVWWSVRGPARRPGLRTVP